MPTKSVASYGIAATCVGLYLSVTLTADIAIRFSFIPILFTNNVWKESYRLVTAMFLHAGFYHLATNLAVFLLVSPILERLFGWHWFALTYLTIGSLGFIGSWVENSASMVPIVGCSGAISFLLGCHLMLFPKKRLPLIRIPFWFIAVPWFIMQLTGYFENGQSSPVAYSTHIGGFVLGLFGASLWRIYGEDTEFRIQNTLSTNQRP